ncbi:MAG: PIN domain-containing protein [Proteobacteria bacterium]|nr:PIN domain-containing protein [Pseudomonadota bacterium]
MIFVDTGAFVARHLKKDPYHRIAIKFWQELDKSGRSCFTSSFVLDETFTLLGRRAGNEFAVQRARAIYASEILTVLRPDLDDELKAISLFSKYFEQAISFTDCVSFVLMKKKKIQTAFSFDSHFEIAGFSKKP